MFFMFDSSIARQYGGSDAAAFIHNLYFWIDKNRANGKHFHDGKTWTYNSMKSFSQLLPFLTKRQVERVINNLRDNGAIITGNYNKSSLDRTLWFTLSDEILAYYDQFKQVKSFTQNSNTQITERGNTNPQNVVTIPDSKPDSKPDKYDDDPPYPPLPAALRNPDYAEVSAEYQRQFALQPMGMTSEVLNQAIDSTCKEAVIYALQQTKANINKPNLRYIEKVIQSMESAGVTDAAGVQAYASPTPSPTKRPKAKSTDWAALTAQYKAEEDKNND